MGFLLAAGIAWFAFDAWKAAVARRKHEEDQSEKRLQEAQSRRILKMRGPQTGSAAKSPPPHSSISALETPAVPILQQLPGKLTVEVAVSARRPTHRIIHLGDLRYVPQDDFATSLHSRLGRMLTRKELDKRYQDHLEQVERVQQEQLVLLQHLIEHHGLQTILQEGVTARDLDEYQVRIDLLKGDLGKDNPQAREARHQVMLQVGAAGRLLARGELRHVLPLDDAELLDRARPVSPDGKLLESPTARRAREDAIVKTSLASGPVAFLVLGAASDLSESVRQLGGGRCEYLRVSTPGLKALPVAGERLRKNEATDDVTRARKMPGHPGP